MPRAQSARQALLALSDKHGLRISGPNCMGSLALREKLLLYPAKRVRGLKPGPVGVVFQSGGTFQFWLQQAALRGLDFSYAISSGNELDLDLADYINFLVDDAHTKIIVCLVEGVRRPQAFMAAAEKALAAGKPILLVKVGRSERGKAATMSHTGAIAADDQVFDAVCRKYGIVRCPSLDDLMETALAFSQGRLPKGNRIAMACYSGGAKGLVLDYASDEGAEMAPLTPETRAKLPGMIDPGLAGENPLDVGPTVGVQAGKVRRDLQGRLRRSDGRSRHRAGPDAGQSRRSIRPRAAAQRVRLDRQAGAGVRPDRAERLRDQPQISRTRPASPSSTACPKPCGRCRASSAMRRRCGAASAAIAEPRGRAGNLDGAAFDALLAAHGLTAPKSALGKTPDEAAAQATRIGFPGRGEDRLARGEPQDRGRRRHARAARCRRRCVPRPKPWRRGLRLTIRSARVEGFLVQEMVAGVEMILGVREDPQFGPFMLAGLGGVAVEAMKDVAIRLLPIDEDTARDMLVQAARRGAARRIPRPAGARPRRRCARHDRTVPPVPRSPAMAVRP